MNTTLGTIFGRAGAVVPIRPRQVTPVHAADLKNLESFCTYII